MVVKGILWARAIPKDALLKKVNNQEKDDKITFNITYHPEFWDVRKILEELHVILVSDDGREEVFPDVPMSQKWVIKVALWLEIFFCMITGNKNLLMPS